MRLLFKALPALFLLAPPSLAQDAVDFAAQQIGKPYIPGAKGPEAFDCSGLTRFAYAQVNVTLPFATYESPPGTPGQKDFGDLVTDPGDIDLVRDLPLLKRGDLLFFDTFDTDGQTAVTHVGIYEGDSCKNGSPCMINARWYSCSQPGAPQDCLAGLAIDRDDITNSYWRPRFLYARRVIECGNDIREGHEACDGSDDLTCPGFCQLDCTCPSGDAECGNGLCEPGETCISCRGDCAPCSDGREPVYAVDNGITLYVIDPSVNQIVASTDAVTSPSPWYLAVSPDGSEVYVPDQYINGVSVVDTDTLAVVAQIQTGSYPYGLTPSTDGSRLFVVNADGPTAGSLSVIDTGNRQVTATIPLGARATSMVVVSPDANRAYLNVAGASQRDLVTVDVPSQAIIGSIPGAGRGEGLAIHPSGSPVYSPGNNGLNIIYPESLSYETIQVIGAGAYDAVVSADGSRLYIPGVDRVSVVNTVSKSLISTISVPDARFRCIALTNGDRYAYAVSHPNVIALDDSVFVIDLMTESVVTEIPLPDGRCVRVSRGIS